MSSDLAPSSRTTPPTVQYSRNDERAQPDDAAEADDLPLQLVPNPPAASGGPLLSVADAENVLHDVMRDLSKALTDVTASAKPERDNPLSKTLDRLMEEPGRDRTELRRQFNSHLDNLLKVRGAIGMGIDALNTQVNARRDANLPNQDQQVVLEHWQHDRERYERSLDLYQSPLIHSKLDGPPIPSN
jgi:hypothetical protein